MKCSFLFALLALTTTAVAAPPVPLAAVPEGGRMYEMEPGTSNVRYDKPSYTKKNGRIYEMEPGTMNIRYDKPSYIEKNGRIYEMESGTMNIRYDKPSYKVQ